MRGRLRHVTERDQVETVLAILTASLVDIEEISMRSRLAAMRTNQPDKLLDPAIERLAELHCSLEQAHQALSGVWHDGQARRWAPRTTKETVP